jgi:hypothetical protein
MWLKNMMGRLTDANTTAVINTTLNERALTYIEQPITVRKRHFIAIRIVGAKGVRLRHSQLLGQG